jgi:RimJ/RimL family protein N-acetyltransferase
MWGSGCSQRQMLTLKTGRLVLRSWCDADLPPFADLNADPRVMAHFPGTLCCDVSNALARAIQGDLVDNGFGLWAVEVPGIAPFIGFVGICEPDFEPPFGPALEIGWRLAFAHWGKGYATEAARTVVAYAFGPLGLEELVSFSVPANRRSRAVMERLGMTHSPTDDFDHPKLPEEHPLRRHVLYRLRRA